MSNIDYFLWNGCDGHRPLLVPKDYVLSPLPIFERELELLDLGRWFGAVIRFGDCRGVAVASAEIYGRLLSACEGATEWIAVCEDGEDGRPLVNVLFRDDRVLTGKPRERLRAAWLDICENVSLRVKYGSDNSLMILHCYGCYRMSFALMHCCRGPCWVMSNADKLLQAAHDICVWELNACCKRPLH
ncbi:hypothetical protein PAV19gp27 [Psittacine adenovirus 3]|uniref:Uncharacterized protein n=1 Tax=Psittacine adenovirus 3 TaxID=1580497 RepID=A0A0A7JT27_9ADEN|nr:hypothetical protein SC17_gp27 [Psittacine adenovirus 3]AIZ35788.1 hypothetical protein PAV19gp27 [Psittacine adenovirus 3]